MRSLGGTNARAGTACVPAALLLLCCTTGVTPLRSTTATRDLMAEGGALVVELGEQWLITGAAGHAGARETKIGDSVWRIRSGALEICRGAPLVCRAIATDGVPPDTLLVARDEPRAPGTARAQNAVWVRALPAGAIRGGTGALAYCSAEGGEPRCAAARFPVERNVLRRVLSMHRLTSPAPKDVAWVALDRTIARCAASPASLDPRCSVVELPDPDDVP